MHGTLFPPNVFRTHSRKRTLRLTPNDSFRSPALSSEHPNWETSLNSLPSRSFPDTLQLLAVYRPEKLRQLERLARAFAEPVVRELESDPGEAS